MQVVVDALIACTLVSGILEERLEGIRRVTAEGLFSHHLDGTTPRLTYRREPRYELEQIVADEQKCCAFLRFTLSKAYDGVLLSIEELGGLGGLGEDARWVFNPFLPGPAPAPEPKRCGCAPVRCR